MTDNDLRRYTETLYLQENTLPREYIPFQWDNESQPIILTPHQARLLKKQITEASSEIGTILLWKEAVTLHSLNVKSLSIIYRLKDEQYIPRRIAEIEIEEQEESSAIIASDLI
jgi:hypothetical protein